MPKLHEVINSLNDETVSDLESVKQALKAEADALEGQNKKLYARAKTAEGFVFDKEKKQWIKKEVKKEVKETEPEKQEVKADTSQYSLADIRALSKVHDDDVERVEKFARAEGVSISEAMKNDDLKAILRDRKEKRATAEASHTGGGRRGVSSTSSERILAEAKKGNYPTDDEGIQKLAEAEMNERLKGLKK